MTRQEADAMLELFGPNGERWCTGALARNANGMLLCDVHNPTAVSWCLVGALKKLYAFGNARREELSLELTRAASAYLLTLWQNDRTFAEVKALIESCVEVVP